LAPPSSLSSNSQPCEFGSGQLSPRPSAPIGARVVPGLRRHCVSTRKAQSRFWCSDCRSSTSPRRTPSRRIVGHRSRPSRCARYEAPNTEQRCVEKPPRRCIHQR
jgi:hypothetical protein